ncbi:MAG TPA: hypothetical protein VNP98_17190 [Chthoniobacterales bacterium]|nr:hypothetical protein [Chthoniobacterales bacterium]
MAFHTHSRRRTDYGFSTKQQGYYRPMVANAWLRHCAIANIAPHPYDDDLAPCRAWYEAELEAATGETSTTKLDRKRDFTAAMAHFETIVGESIYWNMRLHGDDARRIAFNLQEVCQGDEVNEDYMRAIARRVKGLHEDDPLPELAQMSPYELLTIMGELKRFIRRGGRPGVHQENLF